MQSHGCRIPGPDTGSIRIGCATSKSIGRTTFGPATSPTSDCGRDLFIDNIFIERLWRTVKYEEVYVKDYVDVLEAISNLKSYFTFYNHERPHQSLGYRTPAAIYFGKVKCA